MKWRSAEASDLKMSYLLDGIERTYFADFFVDESILVEVKPKKLMESKQNCLKKEAALKFCKEKGYSYRMVDVKTLEENDITAMYESGVIKFINRYDEKMDKRLKQIRGKQNADAN